MNMQNIKQKSDAASSLPVRLKIAMKAAGHRQKDVEIITRISQSQISRILRGEFKRPGKAVGRLEKYARGCLSKKAAGEHAAVQEQLREGICSVWDGTTDDGNHLLRFLDIVKEIRGK